MSNNSFSFWATKDDNKPDLLCGRPADYFVVQKHFTIMICATIVLGGKWPGETPLSLETFLIVGGDHSHIQRAADGTSR